MTPLLAALSSSREAVRKADVVASASPASAARRNRRTAVLSSLLTALLRRRRRSFVPIRLIWLLMLATRDLPRLRSGYRLTRLAGVASPAGAVPQRAPGPSATPGGGGRSA